MIEAEVGIPKFEISFIEGIGKLLILKQPDHPAVRVRPNVPAIIYPVTPSRTVRGLIKAAIPYVFPSPVEIPNWPCVYFSSFAVFIFKKVAAFFITIHISGYLTDNKIVDKGIDIEPGRITGSFISKVGAIQF